MTHEQSESPELLEQAMARMQPDPVHYHFAYSVLPSKLFQGRAASVLLLQYWRSLEKYFRNLWETMAEQVNPESSRLAQLLSVTAHRIGGKHVVLLVKMPPATRVLETHFVAIVFRPRLRYFTLGNSPALIRDGTTETTFREVTGDGANCNLGMGPEPTAKALLLHICRFLDVEPTVEEIEEHEVHQFANQVPRCGPSVFDSAAGIRMIHGFVAETEKRQRVTGASKKLETLITQLSSQGSSESPLPLGLRNQPLEEIDVILGCLFTDWRDGSEGDHHDPTEARGNGRDSRSTSTDGIATLRRLAVSNTVSPENEAFENQYVRVETTKYDLIVRMVRGLMLIGAGAFLGATFHGQFIAGITSHKWPTVTGVITHAIPNSKSVKGRGSRRKDYYYPDVAYTYSVNGKSYVGRRLGFFSVESQDRRVVDRWLSQLLPGKKVPVRYHSGDPSVSVLVPGCGIWTSSGCIIAYLFGLVGLWRLIATAVRFDRLRQAEKEGENADKRGSQSTLSVG